LGDHSVGVTDRKELLRQGFVGLDGGDLAPLRDLFDPDAKWIGIPRSGDESETPTCPNRTAIVDLLERHHTNGRRFELGKKVFSFRPHENVVVRLNDCIDESYALQVLAA
jgi:ketosteroid isomerase-like protein